MSLINLQPQSQLLEAKMEAKPDTKKLLPYRKPEVHSLGSLEHVQGSPYGSYQESNGYYPSFVTPGEGKMNASFFRVVVTRK